MQTGERERRKRTLVEFLDLGASRGFRYPDANSHAYWSIESTGGAGKVKFVHASGYAFHAGTFRRRRVNENAYWFDVFSAIENHENLANPPRVPSGEDDERNDGRDPVIRRVFEAYDARRRREREGEREGERESERNRDGRDLNESFLPLERIDDDEVDPRREEKKIVAEAIRACERLSAAIDVASVRGGDAGRLSLVHLGDVGGEGDSLKNDRLLDDLTRARDVLERSRRVVDELVTTAREERIARLYPDLRCPLSLRLFSDPVVADDGTTYEREHVERWFARCRADRALLTSPATRQIVSDRLVPNRQLKNIRDEMLLSMKGGSPP